MATKSVITKIRRKKMAEASHTTGTVAKITHIALGSGGVNGDGTVIVPLAENVALKKEVVRKPYTSSTKTSDTSYEYTIKLALLVKDIQDSHVIRVILDVNLPPDIVTKLIRAVLISPLGNANVTDKHVL